MLAFLTRLVVNKVRSLPWSIFFFFDGEDFLLGDLLPRLVLALEVLLDGVEGVRLSGLPATECGFEV